MLLRAWRIIPVGKRLVTPIWKGNNPQLGDSRSPWLLTTYPSPGIIIQVGGRSKTFIAKPSWMKIQLSRGKKSIESWLVNRDPYFMVYEIIPTWLGSVSFLYLQQITRGPFFHCSTCRSKTFIQATKGETPPWLASNAIESLWWLWKWKRHGFKWKHGQQKRGNIENKYLPSRKKKTKKT